MDYSDIARRNPRFKDLTGQRFGKLVAKEFTHIVLSNGRPMPAWLCVCDCGNEKAIQGHHLRAGNSKSCGCVWSEQKKPGGNRKDWPGYGAWWQMVNRCENPAVVSYEHYGARGIQVCARWRYGEDGMSGFECFFADMGPPPEGRSLDRIDPNGNYEPANCRWATGFQQRTNTRRSIHAIIGGVKVPLVTYAARTGLRYETLRKKFRKGMDITTAARGLLAGSLALLATYLPFDASAHMAQSNSWQYPLSCCFAPSANRKGDCDQIPFQSVHVGAAGFEITLRPGDHPLVQTEARQFLVPFESAKESPDGQFHLCISPFSGEYRCFFAPPFGM